MATKNPRLNVVLEPKVYEAVQRLAKRDGVSLSLKARDLIKEALEYCEDAYWTEIATKREATFKKNSAVSDKEM